MLALAAAGYSDEPEKCLKKVLPDGQVLNTYTVKCSYETDSLLHITTSWLAYFLDQINWIDYNPPPLISSDCLAFIATDDVAKVIVMSFRGTEGLLQLFEQILQYQRGGKPFYENGHIYEYFFNAFNLIWMGGFEKGAREALAGRTGDDYELWITGYSLGGALASVTSSYIAKLGLFPPSRIKIVTFGQPRTSDYDHAAWHDATFPYSFRVINGRDPVPHIPPKIGPLALFHHGTEVWYPTEMWPLSERKVCAEADGDYCSNRILLWNIMDHIYYFEVDVGEWGKKGCAG
uniref:Lipase_3 domain-containing protein n=1 Tax=Caenorhabditis japonica TaxID=281687 RepID=A0A8R1HRP2_CAEJA